MAQKTYADLPGWGEVTPGDIKDPKEGEIVYIKNEWLNDGEEPGKRYVVMNVNEVSRRCQIQIIDTDMVIHPISLVHWSMITRKKGE